MGQHLARLLYMSALSGCSLIYNPSNLPDKGGEPPDAAIADANPALLHIDEVKSPDFTEGAGQDGSSPQLLVVYGGHITKTAKIKIEPTTVNDAVMLDYKCDSIADDGNSFACVVNVPYLDTLGEADGPIPLTITVEQDGAPAPVKLVDKVNLKPLDELTTGAAVPGKLYSRIDVTGDMVYNPGTARPLIRAVGRIKVTGAVRANAGGAPAAGAGGCAGGGDGADGECFGGGKGGGGGGGGFAAKGEDGAAGSGGEISGDPLLRSYNGTGAAMNRGGGGGGGAGALGGGSGGAIEITAGGTLELGSVEAKGGAGTTSTVLGLGRGGGGGAGGAVVLRAGAMLTMPSAVNVAPGAGGGGVLGGGGAGSVGRWRYDANAVAGTPPTASATPKRGPILVKPANPVFEERELQLMVNGDPANSGSSVDLVVQHGDGTTETKRVNLTGNTSTVVPPMLAIGYNVVCVVIEGGNFANDEAKNCIELAFIP